jgi:C1A family cysteine protease
MQNSWGDGWGQRGYFWMPFEVISAPNTDLWMVHIGRPWEPKA